MTLFRIFVIGIFVCLLVYTVIVGSNHGWDLIPIFFVDMARMEWPGQFNLDFMFMLSLSAFWVSWRHRFSGPGLVLGFLALFGGSLFLSVYLLVISFQSNADPRQMLLGGRG